MPSIKTPSNLNLRQYQHEGVDHLMSGRRKLLLDDMGLGKTAQAIVSFNSLGAKRVLIVCPPAVKFSWAEEIRRWSVRKYSVHVASGMMADVVDRDWSINIVPYSILHSPAVKHRLMQVKWSCTIVDEIHFCKNTEANRTEFVLMRGGLHTRSVFLWGLSGTLMPNTPIDLYAMFMAMGRDHIKPYDNWMKFTKRYCQRYKTEYGWDVSGAKNLGELRSKLFDTGFALMRHKTEVLKDLPPKQYRVLPIEGDDGLTVDQARLLETGDFTDAKLLEPGSEIMRIMYQIGQRKIGPAIDYILSCLESEENLVVFAWHQSVVEAIRDELYFQDVSVSTYYGPMSGTKKERAKQQFINRQSRVFLANHGAAGTGLDGLQKVCAHCVFIETPWTYTGIAQTSDRIHRMGQCNPVLADLLILTGSSERYVMRRVLEKEGYFNQVFGRTENLVTKGE